MRAWHFLKDDMTAGHGNEPAWTEGEERTIKGRKKLTICERGYHSSPTPFDAIKYAPGSMLCLVEIGDPADSQADKYVSRSRKLIKVIDVAQQLREFACDVAEELLNREVQQGRPVDERSRAAIEVVRRFARGNATKEELFAAAAYAYAAYAYAATYAVATYATYAAAAAYAYADTYAVACAVAYAVATDAAYDAAAAHVAAERFNALVEPLFAEVNR